jgi:hypothetical protein
MPFVLNKQDMEDRKLLLEIQKLLDKKGVVSLDLFMSKTVSYIESDSHMFKVEKIIEQPTVTEFVMHPALDNMIMISKYTAIQSSEEKPKLIWSFTGSYDKKIFSSIIKMLEKTVLQSV